MVDDDPNLLALLSDALTSVGYQVARASDGAEASDLFQSNRTSFFDLMISDIKMPYVDGLSLLRRVRRYYHDLPVLFITGVGDPSMVTEVTPDGFLAKPFRTSHLESLVEKTLATCAENHHRVTPMKKVLVQLSESRIRESVSEALGFGNYLAFPIAGEAEVGEALELGEFDMAAPSWYPSWTACLPNPLFPEGRHSASSHSQKERPRS